MNEVTKILLLSILTGKPILSALSDEYLLVLATIVYLVVFYAPVDVGYSLLSYTPAYVTICVLKELLRAKKIVGGNV